VDGTIGVLCSSVRMCLGFGRRHSGRVVAAQKRACLVEFVESELLAAAVVPLFLDVRQGGAGSVVDRSVVNCICTHVEPVAERRGEQHLRAADLSIVHTAVI